MKEKNTAKDYVIEKDDFRLIFQSKPNIFLLIFAGTIIWLFFIIYSYCLFKLPCNIFVLQNSLGIVRFAMLFAGWVFLAYWCVAIFFHTKFILDKEGLHEVTTLFKCNRIKHYPIDKIRKFGVASKSGGNGSINIYVVCTGEDFNVSLHSDSAQEIEYLCRELNRFLKKVKNTGETSSSELNMVEINSLPRGNEKPLESRWDIENDGYGFSLLYQNKHTPWIFWTYCFSEIFVTVFFVF